MNMPQFPYGPWSYVPPPAQYYPMMYMPPPPNNPPPLPKTKSERKEFLRSLKQTKATVDAWNDFLKTLDEEKKKKDDKKKGNSIDPLKLALVLTLVSPAIMIGYYWLGMSVVQYFK